MLRTLVEGVRERGQNLVVVYVDLEKAYDRVDRELLWAKLAARGMTAGSSRARSRRPWA